MIISLQYLPTHITKCKPSPGTANLYELQLTNLSLPILLTHIPSHSIPVTISPVYAMSTSAAKPKDSGMSFFFSNATFSHQLMLKILGLVSSLHQLSISSPHRMQTTDPIAPSSTSIVESWEEEADSPPPSAASSPPHTPTSPIPSAPPPTPIAAAYPWRMDWGRTQTLATRNGYTSPPPPPTSRPEKQTGVAGRLIAGALGVKAPPKSEDGKAYERAVRENEKRRLAKAREKRRREEEEAERAKRQIWEG